MKMIKVLTKKRLHKNKTKVKTHQNYRYACLMVLVAILEVRGNLRNVDPLSHSFHRQNRLHLMLLSDRCHLNLRQCFVLVMMPSPDVSILSRQSSGLINAMDLD